MAVRLDPRGLGIQGPRKSIPQRGSQVTKTAESPSTRDSFPNQDFPYYKESLDHVSPLGVWTKFYKSDPRIALGKYSPMEKQFLHLGGIHTTAARRYLVDKFSEERKMLRELQLQSSDYKKVTKDKTYPTFPCVLCDPPEKLWTAQVRIPAEKFKMPEGEKVYISKHIERMQLARTLRNKPSEPYLKRFRSAGSPSQSDLGSMGQDKAEEEGDSQSRDISDNSNQEDEEEEAKHTTTKTQEIEMNVTFKSEEPKQCLICHQKDVRPFFPVKKRERFITGLTNRNVLSIADFPGDLMLMNQYSIAQGLHPKEAIRTYWLPEKNTWQVKMYKADPYPY